jgi:hypothetical protein
MTYVCSLPNPGEPGNAKELFDADPALIEQFVRAEDRPGRGVYDCINPLEPDARSRCLDTVAELKRVYFDFDTRSLEESRDEVIRRLQQLPVAFTDVHDSGGGIHAIIEIKDPPPRGTAEYNKASRYGNVWPTSCAQIRHQYIRRR